MQSDPPHTGFNVPYSGTDAMRGLADGLIHMLRMTRALIAGDRRVDIGGLERQVGLLCAKTLDLAPGDGRTLRPTLINLLADLDALSLALVRQAHAHPVDGITDS